MTTDIDKLAQQMREAATGVEAALPHGTWDSVRAYHRAQDRFRNVADTESVLALLDDRERLWAALKNAAGFIDTPVMRRRHGGEQFYSEVVDSVRAALATSGGSNG